MLRHEQTPQFLLFLDLIKVIHDYTYKQIEDKLTAKDHKDDKEGYAIRLVRIFSWLFSRWYTVGAIMHHVDPALRRHQLDQRPHPKDDVIKILILILPISTRIQAVLLSLDIRVLPIAAPMKIALKEVDTEDGKYENEEEAYDGDIGHGWQRGNQGVYNQLHSLVSWNHS